jgi:hypothetical protein
VELWASQGLLNRVSWLVNMNIHYTATCKEFDVFIVDIANPRNKTRAK